MRLQFPNILLHRSQWNLPFTAGYGYYLGIGWTVPNSVDLTMSVYFFLNSHLMTFFLEIGFTFVLKREIDFDF